MSAEHRPWRDWHLIAPREPTLDCCSHGRPDHQAMIRQLSEAMGYDLPGLNATPAQVWAGLLNEVERRFRTGTHVAVIGHYYEQPVHLESDKR